VWDMIFTDGLTFNSHLIHSRIHFLGYAFDDRCWCCFCSSRLPILGFLISFLFRSILYFGFCSPFDDVLVVILGMLFWGCYFGDVLWLPTWMSGILDSTHYFLCSTMSGLLHYRGYSVGLSMIFCCPRCSALLHSGLVSTLLRSRILWGVFWFAAFSTVLYSTMFYFIAFSGLRHCGFCFLYSVLLYFLFLSSLFYFVLLHCILFSVLRCYTPLRSLFFSILLHCILWSTCHPTSRLYFL
jgi:hypothetical protein